MKPKRIKHIGKVYPLKTLFFRLHSGEATDGERSYDLSTTTQGQPLVRSKITGRFWGISWKELVELAIKAGIDKEAP